MSSRLNALAASSSNAPKQITLRFNNTYSCSRHALRSSAHHPRSSSSRAQGYTAAEEPQQGDLVSGMLNSCLSAAAHVAETAVSRLADALQSVAPPAAPRHKIEVSVKGGLLLLLLGLLKGVISFVLLVGCIGLAVYTATQVFGWNGVVLRQTWPDQGSYQQQQYPPNQPPLGQGYPGQQAYRQQYGHQQFGRQQQQGNGRQGEQEDLVDVFHYPRPAPQ